MDNKEAQLYANITSHNTLSILGGIFLVFGIVGAIGLCVLAGVVNNDSDYQSWGASGVDPYLIAAGIFSLFQGALIYALLRGLSDIIRLLMDIARRDSRQVRQE